MPPSHVREQHCPGKPQPEPLGRQHVVPRHTSAPSHWMHPGPQLARLFRVSVQTPSQLSRPAGQQSPSLQTLPPHSASVQQLSSGMHLPLPNEPPHHLVPVGQTQAPFRQTVPLRQSLERQQFPLGMQ